MNYAHFLKRYAALWPEKTFIVDGQRRFTFRGADERVNALARGLLDLGVRKGDRVATLIYNRAECFEIFLAACKIGVVYVALNYRLAPAEVAYILGDSGAKLLFSEEEFSASVDSILGEVPGLAHCASIGKELAAPWKSYDRMIAANLGARVPDAEVGLNDLQRIMYTSGTTAHPKGVMLTNNNVYWKSFAHLIEFRHTSDEVVLICGPLYHVGGMDVGATSVMLLGAKLVIMRRFEPEAVLKAIESERVTFMWAAPSMMKLLFEAPNFDRYDLSSLRHVPTGSEKTPLPLLEESKRKLPNAHYYDGFGMTETVSGDIMLDQIENPEKVGSLGLLQKPVVGVELRVVDESGRDTAPEEPGEMLVKGPKVFQGYWGKPELNAEIFTDGWFHTGDIGKVDRDGYLYIIDRKKDMIITGGENVGSLEVERVLEQHPKIKEVAVVGVPHERWGETVKAVVAVKEGQALTPGEVIRFCEGKLARFKTPKVVEFVGSLPRTLSGKVMKYKLREQDPKR